jgi:hypothetical protein
MSDASIKINWLGYDSEIGFDVTNFLQKKQWRPPSKKKKRGKNLSAWNMKACHSVGTALSLSLSLKKRKPDVTNAISWFGKCFVYIALHGIGMQFFLNYCTSLRWVL